MLYLALLLNAVDDLESRVGFHKRLRWSTLLPVV